jgi:rhamnogalacturonan endolyase
VVFSEEARPKWPVSTEQGFVFRKGEPGFYYYLSYRHPADMPDVLLQQTRMTFRVKEGLFHKAYIDRDRIYDVVPLEEWEGHVSVMDSTYMLTDGRIIRKYTWSTRKENQRFYGFAGEEAGVWHLFPSMEHVNGGANKQSNTIQHSPEGPIVLNVMSSSHYGAEMTRVSGEWSKLYGPFFVMVTDEKGWQKNLAAAEENQREMVARWPFAWFETLCTPESAGSCKARLRWTAVRQRML